MASQYPLPLSLSIAYTMHLPSRQRLRKPASASILRFLDMDATPEEDYKDTQSLAEDIKRAGEKLRILFRR